MDLETNAMLTGYVGALSAQIRKEYLISEENYADDSVKRGLRNMDGSGVVAGVSRIGSVQGYYFSDGARVPMEGHLYYRGYDVEDIVRAHRADNTFGYEEVAYLLL